MLPQIFIKLKDGRVFVASSVNGKVASVIIKKGSVLVVPMCDIKEIRCLKG